MPERYTRVYLDNVIKYTKSSPVLIEAKSLLEDHKSLKLVAQIKFRNISVNVISALYIKIETYDVLGEKLETLEYQYLDLKACREDTFGTKKAIELTDDKARSFSVTVEKVISENKVIWENQGCVWSEIPKAESLREIADGPKFIEYYHKIDVSCPKIKPMNCDDLWFCCCGAVNHTEEICCNQCKVKKENIFYVLNSEYMQKESAYIDACKKMDSTQINILGEAIQLLSGMEDWKDSKDKLQSVTEKRKKLIYNEAEKNASGNTVSSVEKALELYSMIENYEDSESRIEEAQKKLEELRFNEAQSERLRKDRNKKIGIISGIASIVLIALIAFYKVGLPYIQKYNQYKSAMKSVEDKDYDTACKELKKLGDFKDAKKQLKKIYSEHGHFILKSMDLDYLYSESDDYIDTFTYDEQGNISGVYRNGSEYITLGYSYDDDNHAISAIARTDDEKITITFYGRETIVTSPPDAECLLQTGIKNYEWDICFLDLKIWKSYNNGSTGTAYYDEDGHVEKMIESGNGITTIECELEDGYVKTETHKTSTETHTYEYSRDEHHNTTVFYIDGTYDHNIDYTYDGDNITKAKMVYNDDKYGSKYVYYYELTYDDYGNLKNLSSLNPDEESYIDEFDINFKYEWVEN